MEPSIALAFTPGVAALGTPAFAGELLAALNRFVRADHLSLMRFHDAARPPALESAVWRGGEHVAEVQHAYVGGLYREDPNLRLESAGVCVRRLHRAQIRSPAYRDACYERAGVLERLTIAAPHAGRLVALNLYGREPSGGFAQAELGALKALALFLAALAVKHVGLLGMLRQARSRGDRLAYSESRLRALDAGLPRRELDVLARILTGMTSEGIALDLGIRLNTVLTYRKRAYARLGVTSQAELFARCLG